jgi:hypothetical protein
MDGHGGDHELVSGVVHVEKSSTVLLFLSFDMTMAAMTMARTTDSRRGGG